ncbi:MAG: tRNA lysidine(34) synthetase TilS [Oscillospiraceae bacterium]
MQEKVKAVIAKYNMLSAGETVFAALSGGADSVALLLVLAELSENTNLNFGLAAVHVNHMLRGEESDRDEAFCRDLCKKMNIPLTVFREDAAAFSRSLGVSVETGARELRYKLFDSLNADKIATAHNLNDNAETVLFRMARGTGLHGLTGIPPVRGKIIRPLILCTRDEIEEYLHTKRQNFVTDSTNLCDDFARNRIRHKIMPEMSAVHEGFLSCVSRMTASLAEDEDFLMQEALKCESSDLRTLHPAIRKRVIINLLKTHKLKINAAKIEEIDSLALSGNGKTEAENGIYVLCENGKLRVYSDSDSDAPEPKIITEYGEYPFHSDKIVKISKETDEKMFSKGNVNKKSTIYYADCDKIQDSIVLRNRLRGDKIKPVGSAHTKELRKLLQERLPKEERKLSAVLEDKNGIIWAEHAGISDRVKTDENTKNYLVIEIKKKF